MTSPWFQDAIEQYGRQSGLPDLTVDDAGCVNLALGSGGMIVMQELPQAPSVGADALVAMGRPLGFEAERLTHRALELAHFASGLPFEVRVAVRGAAPEGLLYGIVGLSRGEFTGHAIEGTVAQLRRWFEEVCHG